MFITKLILHKCNRFYLKGIETFEVNPTSKTQIVLGTNGSGKSSLLKVGFNVLPADKNDFAKGGYKLVHVLNKGKSYELLTDFSGKAPTHSFICDGEELNDGKTGAVQRELVREHFGMTTDLNNVLTGTLKFTDMSAQQRREWITLLSSADFDYVISLHARVKRAVRDTSAVIKHQSGRLVQESAKRIDDATYNTLRKQSQEVCDRLIELHQNSKRDLDSKSFSEYEHDYHRIVAHIDMLLNQVRDMRLIGPACVDGTGEEAIVSAKEGLRSRIQMLEAALHEVSEQHQEIDRQLHQLNELEDIDPVALEQQIKSIRDEIETMSSSYRSGCDPKRLPEHLYPKSIVDELSTMLHDIDTEAGDYTDHHKLNAKQEELSELQHKLMAGTGRIGELEYRLQHIGACSSITCPQCAHSFKEGVNANEESEIRQLLTKGYAFKSAMEGKINDVKEWIGKSREAMSAIYEVDKIRRANPELIGLWDLIERNGGFSKGRILLPLCRSFASDIELHVAILERQSSLQPLIDKLNSVRSIDGSQQLREVANSMSERVVNLRELLLEARESLKDVERFQDQVTEVRHISKSIEDAKVYLDELMDKMVRNVVLDELEAQVRRHQVTLASLEQALAEAEVQIGIITDINKSLDEARKEETALIMLEKLLSPKDGVIAEQIMVFINTFISGINDVISKVWGYNLALDRCNLEEGELDYKFPIYVHNSDNIVEDIKYGSDSQVDIINQAFRLITYRFLELQGFPLYLDELGRTFDEVHRLNLTLALKDLMDDDMYSQVFLISHSFESQNSYPNSQIIVIDDAHVSLKREYNEHVTIS